MPLAALADARTGPLVSPWIILLLALAFITALWLASRTRLRARRPWLLPEVGVLAALALLHLLFFWQPYRTAAHVPRGGGDLASFFYPLHAFAAREVQDGRLPFWNPHQFAGMPHLANFQAATLYPPNLLAYLLARPFDYATLELLAILHYLLASYGAYWLGRELGARRPGALLTGALFAYSGFLVAHLGHYSMLASAAWLPLVLAAVVATVRRDSWAAAAGGAAALTCAVLGGHQPILLLSLTLVTAVALFELWRSAGYPPPTAWTADRSLRVPLARRVIRLTALAIVAAGMATPALGTWWELNAYTVRTTLTYQEASRFAVQPIALVHLVLPTVFGSNPTDYWGAFSNTETWGYVGTLAPLLAALAVATRPSRSRWFWLLTAVAALLFLLGPFASLHGWAYGFLPGWDRVRAAGRAYLVFDLAVAILAGFGLDALLARREQWSTRLTMSVKWGIAGLAGALAVVVGFVIPMLTSRVLSVDDPGNRPVIALDNANLLALWLLLGLGVGLAAWRGALRGGALAFAVIAVVLLDLFHATAPFNPSPTPVLAGFRHAEVVAFLQSRYQDDGPFRIESLAPSWQPDLARLAGLDDIGGLFDPLGLRAYADYRTRAIPDRSSEDYLRLNVRYVLTDDQSGPPATGYHEAFRAGGIVVWEAPHWHPRAWLAGADTPVTATLPNPNTVRLTLPPDAPGGQLVVSQVAYPGWTATVNGTTAALQSDDLLQTVQVPPGSVAVELRFRPTRWTLWLLVSAASTLALLGMLAWSTLPALARRRRSGIVAP